MASLFRSISIKIFGIAAGLLALMIATSLVSASLTNQVHRQLRTLSESLVPLTMTLADLRSNMLTTRLEIARQEQGGVPPAACRATAAKLSAEGDRLIVQAEALRALGAELAVLERNRLKLARLEGLIEAINDEHKQLDALVLRQCANTPGSDTAGLVNAEADSHVAELAARANAVSAEISTFVAEGGRIVEQNQELAARANMALIAASALVGLLLAYLVTRGLTRPIIRLQAGARAVQAGDLNSAVPVTSSDEIGDVTTAFNEMVEGLRSRERIKETFGQYVDPRVVSGLISGSTQSIAAGEKQVATLYFSDLAGFTSIAERLAPSTVVALVNAYFAEMSRPIRDHHGIIDKYMGDGIMAFWVPPFADASTQALEACKAALIQFERLEAFRAQVPDIIGLRRDIPQIAMRVGISTGEVVVGSIGSEIARSFTVMGDSVNFGSRLEGTNKVYGTNLLIDGMTRDRAGAAIEVREIDLLAVVGRDEPSRVFELAGLAGGLSDTTQALFDAYADGLSHYRSGAWIKAEKAFKAALAIVPTDGPATTMLARCEQLRATPPANWDGVWRLTKK
jgi:class 3 adenylate cyclase